MNHEIDLQKYQIRTDLAIETIEQNNIPKGITSTENIIDNIRITNVYINNIAGTRIGKKEGNYITIEFKDITDYNNKEKVKNIFSIELKKLLEQNKITEEDTCLILGLGNSKSTPDALGPLSINHILVTNHLFMFGEVEKGFRRTYAISPGVMGETGIETSDIIKGIIDSVKPDCVIVIDALASQSVERVNTTIQMTDTGIHPGSGVGNSRKEISKEIFDIPVIAIGVPTVVDAVTIVSDTINYMFKHFSYTKENINNPSHKLAPPNSINYLKKDIETNIEDKQALLGMIGNLNDNELKQLIFEVLTPIGYNLMVTPKEVDFVIEKLSDIIGNGINKALHQKVDNL